MKPSFGSGLAGCLVLFMQFARILNRRGPSFSSPRMVRASSLMLLSSFALLNYVVISSSATLCSAMSVLKTASLPFTATARYLLPYPKTGVSPTSNSRTAGKWLVRSDSDVANPKSKVSKCLWSLALRHSARIL